MADSELQGGFEELVPSVNSNAEFFEIAHDFGDALELVREAISNSLDAGANTIEIRFDVEEIDGDSVLVLKIKDDGEGMTEEVLKTHFWGLGYSTSRGNPEKIGEKGHGTKIYLRSEKIVVRTQTEKEAWESICDNPIKSLYRREIHRPRIRRIEKFDEHPGTEITIFGYNKSARSGTKYFQENIVDFIRWFTKFGSIEREFHIDKFSDAILLVKGLDRENSEPVEFGHIFPPESPSIDKLFDKYGTSNESELFALLISLVTLKPKLFEFEPLDYVTSRGVDILARTRTDRPVSESEFLSGHPKPANEGHLKTGQR